MHCRNKTLLAQCDRKLWTENPQPPDRIDERERERSSDKKKLFFAVQGSHSSLELFFSRPFSCVACPVSTWLGTLAATIVACGLNLLGPRPVNQQPTARNVFVCAVHGNPDTNWLFLLRC